MTVGSYFIAIKGKRRIRIAFSAAVVAGVVAFYTSMAQESDINVAGLQGRWTLETLNGQPVELSMAVYFEIDGHTLKGFDGCNNFGGPLENPVLIRKGQRDCAGEYVSLPLDLGSPLEHLRQASVTGDVLSLPIPQGGGEATFRRDG
jgi:hypothetical protein